MLGFTNSTTTFISLRAYGPNLAVWIRLWSCVRGHYKCKSPMKWCKEALGFWSGTGLWSRHLKVPNHTQSMGLWNEDLLSKSDKNYILIYNCVCLFSSRINRVPMGLTTVWKVMEFFFNFSRNSWTHGMSHFWYEVMEFWKHFSRNWKLMECSIIDMKLWNFLKKQNVILCLF